MIQQPSDLVHKLRKEHAELGAELEALEGLLAAEEAPDNRRRLREVVDRLLTTLPRHFRFEEQGGYLTEVVARYPTWSTDVEQLRREHGELLSCVEELRDLLERQAEARELAEPVRRLVQEVIAHIHAHERHENRLVQEAFNLDVGSAD